MTLPLVRVLMVDDDEDIRQVMGFCLDADAGFELHACAGLDEALAALADFTPDLLLIDVEMPGADGPATLARLRLEPGTASTPVVFLTARLGPARLALYRELGARTVVEKPFDIMTLLAILRAAVDPTPGRR